MKAWAQRLDMLNFQVKEIEEAGLKINEEDELVEEKINWIIFKQYMML